MSLRNRPVKYIHVPVTRPQTERQEQARVGDWILTSERGYKVYTPKAFSVAFDKVNDVPTKSYPYPDGDVLVLGPEVIGADGVVSWKGENYYSVEQGKYLFTNNLSPEAANPNQGTLTENGHPVDPQDEALAERRVLESDIRNQALDGKMTPEEAEMKIHHLPVLDIQPVGMQPLPKQPLASEEPRKAREVWADVEAGKLTEAQAQVELGIDDAGVSEPGALTMVTIDQPDYLCTNCMRPKRRDSVGEFCVECGGIIVSRDDVLAQQATTPTEGSTPVSTPEDPSTHVGVDLEEDEALKAGIDLTDENAILAADMDEQLTADAMKEDI